MTWTIYNGDCLEVLRTLPDCSVQCCVTSPPYWGLRDYGVDGQLGLESSPDLYVGKMVEVFREVRRVLRDDGTLWLNLGDSYATSSKHGSGYGEISATAGVGNSQKGVQSRCGCPSGLKPKDLVGIPWRVAFALQADGWWLRQDIIWHKPNPMPESVRDRCTKAHEYVFLLTKSERYYYNKDAISSPAKHAGKTRVSKATNGSAMQALQNGKKPSGNGVPGTLVTIAETTNRRSVWTIATKPYKGAHFATMPPTLVEPCVMAGTKAGDLVLDPFNGSGTTGAVAIGLRRNYVGIELNSEYIKLANERISKAERDAKGRLL